MHASVRLKVAIGLIAIASFGAPASAQEAARNAGWTGQATIYGWIPAVNGAQEGRDGEPVIDLDQQDVLSRLDMAFMGAAEIRKDRFGLLLDVVYADLSNDGEWVRGRLDTETGLRLGMYTVAAAYRVHEADRRFVDLYAGARFFDAKLSFDFSTPDFDARDRDASLEWADPIVGVRGAMPLTERWSVSGFADVGGFDGRDDLSWELYGGANYAITGAWSATLGYRYMSVLYQATDRAKLDVDIQGPVVGITYAF
jgi:opacity protein-like surface antigen